MKPLCHLSIYQGDLFTRLKLVCIKNQNIRKNKSKFERPLDGDNGENYRQNLHKGTWKSVRIIEIFELSRFDLRKGTYKSFLRKFHGDFKFVLIMETFELWRFELGRINCNDVVTVFNTWAMWLNRLFVISRVTVIWKHFCKL